MAFFFYSEAIICPQLRLITAVYHTTCTHQPGGILPDLLVFLLPPIKCFISSDNVKSRSGVKIAVTTWSHFPFSGWSLAIDSSYFCDKICLNSCSSQRKDPSGLSQGRTSGRTFCKPTKLINFLRSGLFFQRQIGMSSECPFSTERVSAGKLPSPVPTQECL